MQPARNSLPLVAQLRLGHALSKVRFSPTGLVAALLAERDELQVLELRARELSALYAVGSGRAAGWGERQILDFSFSSAGDLLAIVGLQQKIGLFEGLTGRALRSLGHLSFGNDDDRTLRGYRAVIFMRDSSRLIAQVSQSARADVIDIGMDNVLSSFGGMPDVSAFTMHPEGYLLAILDGPSGESSHAVRFGYVTATGIQTYSARPYGWFDAYGIVFSPDGKSWLSVGRETAISFEMRSFPECEVRFRWFDESLEQDPPLGFEGPFIERAVFSPDSLRFLLPYPTGELLEIDTRTGEEHRRWPIHDSIVFSADVDYTRGLLVTAGLDGWVKLWQLPYSGKPPKISGHQLTEAFLSRFRPVDPFENDENTFEEIAAPESLDFLGPRQPSH